MKRRVEWSLAAQVESGNTRSSQCELVTNELIKRKEEEKEWHM